MILPKLLKMTVYTAAVYDAHQSSFSRLTEQRPPVPIYGGVESGAKR